MLLALAGVGEQANKAIVRERTYSVMDSSKTGALHPTNAYLRQRRLRNRRLQQWAKEDRCAVVALGRGRTRARRGPPPSCPAGYPTASLMAASSSSARLREKTVARWWGSRYTLAALTIAAHSSTVHISSVRSTRCTRASASGTAAASGAREALLQPWTKRTRALPVATVRPSQLAGKIERRRAGAGCHG